jgi:hypothetical protein
LYNDEAGNPFYFAFNGTGYTSIDEDELAGRFKPRYKDRGWEMTAEGLKSTWDKNTENILYIDIGKDIGSDYEISVSAAMNNGPGYGILFDTTGEGSNENGYSLQYERRVDGNNQTTGGQIIIRPRINGSERINIEVLGGIDNWEKHWLYESLSANHRKELLEKKTISPVIHTYILNAKQFETLEAESTLHLKAKDSDSVGKRVLEVSLQGQKVIGGFEYKVADNNNPINTSGFRVWENRNYWGDEVLFKSFDIKNSNE